jgi:arylsulfatase A-like enzyme
LGAVSDHIETNSPNIFSEVFGFHRGVDHFLSFDHPRLLNILDGVGDAPVFLFLHFSDVHFPYGLVRLDVTGEAEFAAKVSRIAELSGAEFQPHGLRLLDFAEINDPREWKYIQHYLQAMMQLYKDQRYADLMRLYCESVEEMDTGRFRRMAAELDRRGWMENAHICLFGDHGEEFSERCFMHHDSVVEGAVHVPIAFVSPDLPVGKTDDAVVRTIDIMPTLLELSGIEPPNELDGISLTRRMTGNAPLDLVAKGETFVYYQTDAARAAEARNRRFDHYEKAVKEKLDLGGFDWPDPTLQWSYARDGRWKLMVKRDLIAMSEEHFVYDLKSDVTESVNLSDAQPRARSSLHQELGAFVGAALDQDRSLANTDANRILNELADMGYLHGRTPTN